METKTISNAVLAQLLVEARAHAAAKGRHGELEFCGFAKNWQECVEIHELKSGTFCLFYFNVGRDTMAIKKELNNGL